MYISGPKNGTVWRSHFGTVIVTTLLFSFPTTLADPFLGPPGGPIFGPSLTPILQAVAFFRWMNAAVADAPSGRQPLLINMDETSLAYHFCGLRGTVLKLQIDSREQPSDAASLSEIRGHVSYLASVASDPEVQALLPQVLLGNEHRFTKTLLRSVEKICPPQVHLWRQKSAWNSHATMRRYICLLAKTLGSLVHERYVILIVDTAKAHIHQSIYKLARQRGLRLVFVPARMTRWLQPCDTHVFGPFKTALMENWKRSKSEATEGVVDAQRWLQVIFKTIDQVLPGDWSKAFHRDGILNQQADLSDKIRASLGWKFVPVVPTTPPTLEEAKIIFPNRMRLNFMSYIHWGPPEKPLPAAPDASSSCGPAPKRRKFPPTFRGRPVLTLD